MPGIRGETLLATTYFIKRFTLNRAWLGLIDDELFWEPVAGMWGVRRREQCNTPNPFGSADPDWVADCDGALTSVDYRTTTEPLTTIGWLFWHVGSQPGRLADLDFLGGSKRMGVNGDTSPYGGNHPIFTTAADAVDTMRTGWRLLIDRLRSATDDDLQAPTGRTDGQGPATGAEMIAFTLNEISHHGSQICTLRDLYILSGGGTFVSR